MLVDSVGRVELHRSTITIGPYGDRQPADHRPRDATVAAQAIHTDDVARKGLTGVRHNGGGARNAESTMI